MKYRKINGKKFTLFGIKKRKNSANKIKKQLQKGDKLVRLFKVKNGYAIWFYQKQTKYYKKLLKQRRFKYLK